MTSVFSWLLTRKRQHIRLLLIGTLLIQLDRVTGQWVVRWATPHMSVWQAHIDAVKTTAALEADGLTLDGPVFMTNTDTEPWRFTQECVSGRQVGPRVDALLSVSKWEPIP